MTYDESAALMVETKFRGRIKVSCMKYANYIQGEDPNTQGHSARYRWANETVKLPDQMAIGLQPAVVMDPAVQAAGVDANGQSLIADAALQSAVEGVINKIV